jgi:predicted amidohydrolase
VKVAAIQHDIEWEDPPANFARLRPMIATAADAVDGPSAAFLVDEACRHRIWVCGSIPEVHPGDDRPANTLVLAEPDGAVHRYRKIHPFTYGGEHEKYAPGHQHVTVDVEGLRCSLFVCYDLRFADEFWALAPATDCYLVPANWPAARRDHWRTLLRARAIENQAYVVGVNRVGTGGRLDYSGDSAIVGPLGEIVAEAEAGAHETMLLGEIDPSVVTAARTEFPFLADRR